MLKLYTKDRCVYCYILKEKLDDWGVDYEEENQTDDLQYDLYPQLFYDDKDVLKSQTSRLTKSLLYDRIDRIQSEPSLDWNAWHEGDLVTRSV